MRQEQKDKGAISKKLKISIILVLAVMVGKNAFAQKDDFGFQRIFLKNFQYPIALKNACTSTYTNLLIDVSKDGMIEDIFVSDSAPSLFKDEFEKVKSHLNTDSLKQIIIDKNIKSGAILIPVFFCLRFGLLC